ncbi:MAG: hypothetical protein QF363_04515 [Planctomycetaceae bacterium]|jgi:hypothetical protein|nr:hypothetical protein [Planctomycetaceae bacterium]
MTRLFVSNFGFEIELQGKAIPASVMHSTKGLAECWQPIFEDGDRVLAEDQLAGTLSGKGGAPPPWLPDTGISQVIPWGWNHSSAQLARIVGCAADIPDLDVVKTLNRRRWAWGEAARGLPALEGADVVSGIDELRDKLAAATSQGQGWILKGDLGMAGRQQRRGREAVVDDSLGGWAQGRLRIDGVLFVEPWLDALDEFGVQFHVERNGTFRLCGVTQLLSTSDGRYRGTRIRPAGVRGAVEELGTLLSMLEPVVTRIGETGYFGPLGIDAMLYRDPAGEARWRPLQDVNARFTMGRLALGWLDRVATTGAATVLQVRWGHTEGVDDRLRDLADEIPGIRQLVRYSPRGPAVAPAGLILLVVDCERELAPAEARVIEAVEDLGA